jgi:myo-inositol-1(or 4)-monophosphatase
LEKRSITSHHCLTFWLIVGDSWKAWDYAAGMLVLTEAGGCLSQINGEGFHLFSPSIVSAATNQLRQEMVEVVDNLYK